METMIEVACHYCEKIFSRRIAEINRIKKLGRNCYCSSKCSGQVAGKKNIHFAREKSTYDISKHKKQCDEYSPFRRFTHKIRTRLAAFLNENSNKYKKNFDKEKHEFTITLPYLKELWEEQKGKCPFTGIELILSPKQLNGKFNGLYLASLDRIDSSKGYIEGNVQFVSLMYNYCKNNFTDDQVKEFIKISYKNLVDIQ